MRLCFDGVQIQDQGRFLVSDLSFQLHSGQTSAIVGPSRSGKSTLLLLAAGALTPNEGRVFVSIDKDARDESSLFRPDWRTVGLGPISNFSPLFDTLTVREHLSFQLRLHKQSDRKHRLAELMADFDLTDVQNQRIKDIDQFSQFRTTLANTTALQPNFILLDEPERGLSQVEWQYAKDYFQQLTSNGVGILFTTVLESAADWSHFIIYLPTGEVHTRESSHGNAP